MVALRGAAAGVGSLKLVLGVLMVDFSGSADVGLGTFGAGGFVGFHIGNNPFGYNFWGRFILPKASQLPNAFPISTKPEKLNWRGFANYTAAAVPLNAAQLRCKYSYRGSISYIGKRP
jgi:hypothetical protein